MRKLLLLLLLPACRIDLPEFTADDALSDAAVPDAMPSPDMMVLDPAMLTTPQLSPYDFGDVTVDQTSGSLQIIVRNSGEATTSPLMIEVTGDTDDFEQLVAGSDDCAGITLAAQATCIAEVRFAPGTAGPHNATVTVSATEGGSVSVDLDGNALTPGDLEITAGATMSFNAIEIQSQSTTQTLTVHNTGGTATAALDTILSDETNYTITTDGCDGMMLAADGTCDVVVRFDPTTVGTLPASISVRESPSVGVAASATGLGSARLRVDKTGLGNVTSNPANIACSTGCTTETDSFTQTPVTLTAMNNDVNYVFDSWTGACAGETTTSCSVSLTAPLTTVGVVFRQLDCTPDTIVCDDATDHYVDCDSVGNVEMEMDCALGCVSGMEKCNDVNPSNGLASYLDLASDGVALSFTGSSTINTTTGAVFNAGASATVDNALVGNVRVYWVKSLSVVGSLKVSGTPALAFVVDGNVSIQGTIDVSGDQGINGPGFQTGSCNGGAPAFASPVGGGGGGGHYLSGAGGGSSSTPSAGGGAGGSNSDPDISPLVGGCKGGTAATSISMSAPRGAGGGGGGAVQITSRTSIAITGAGTIDASGGGGRGGYSILDGSAGPGGGGGSGGSVLLEAPTILLDGPSVIVSTKGGAGGGVGETAVGEDGGTDSDPASGGSSGAAIGGNGGTLSTSPTIGANATTSPGHGAGGGAYVGETRFNNVGASLVPQNGAAIRSRSSAGVIGSRVVP